MDRAVLIVSPHFPPINAPDHQRVRMGLPFFQDFGWETTCLAVRPDCVEGVLDTMLEKSLPASTRVVRTGALPHRMTRKVGLGSLALRAAPYLRAAGNRLLRQERFDLVFFSTTQFPVMALGPGWGRRYGVPYVLDFQDPWRNDHYQRTGVRPPGGRFKYAFARLQARFLEPYTLKRASHAVCVSPAYPKMFLRRYSWLQPRQFTVLPFGAAESDFSFLLSGNVRQTVFDPRDGKRHWVFVGVCGPYMVFALRAFFKALVQALTAQPSLRQELRLHFIGTDYAPKDRARKTVEPLAVEAGVADMVIEQTDRVPYFEALRCLLDAEALIVPGSDDPGYTASKIYPYILARKPMLAIFHEQSSVVDILNKTKAGTVVSFRSGETVESVADRIVATNWLSSPISHLPSPDWVEFAPYTAREMTRRLCQVFDKVVAGRAEIGDRR